MIQNKLNFRGLPSRKSDQMVVIATIVGYTCLMMIGVGQVELFDWDEINFAEIAREMTITGDYLQPTINFVPFHEKPPLFAWLQVASYQVFGVNSFAARFPNVLCGAATLFALWLLGGKGQSGRLPLWWMAFMGLSLLPQLYFRSGIIDPWFNLFILLALWPIFVTTTPGWGKVLQSGFWLGLAVLTKGPAAGLIAGLCCLVLLLTEKSGRGKRALRYLSVGLLSLIPSLIWIALLWREDGGQLVGDFLEYQWRLFSREDAGHGGFPGYHFIVLLLGCFPASLFALPGISNRMKTEEPQEIRGGDRGMLILFWVVLLLFSVVSTKIVHYSSLAYFPTAWFAARWVANEDVSAVAPRWLVNSSVAILGLFTAGSLLLPVLARNAERLTSVIRDPELLSRLSMPVSWPWYTFIPALLLLGTIIAVTKTKNITRSCLATICLVGISLFTAAGLWAFTPRIQEYSQGALTDFFVDRQSQNVYVGTAYHKSYAQWFYSDIQPDRYRNGRPDRQWRFHGATDKPLYFSSPLRKTDQVLREVPDATLLHQRGGYSFYLRPPGTATE